MEAKRIEHQNERITAWSNYQDQFTESLTIQVQSWATQTTDPREAHRTFMLLLKCAVHIHMQPAFLPVGIQ